MAALLLAAAAASFGVAVHAVAIEPTIPQQTGAAIPQTTVQQPSEITTPPSASVLRELLRRSVEVDTILKGPDNTCGYISGLSNSAYTCGYTDGYCAIVTVGHTGAVGCCNSDNDCGFAIDCVDRAQLAAGKCTGSCLTDTMTAKCTDSDYPYCGTVRFFSSINDYFCHTVGSSVPMEALTSYIGEGSAHKYSQVVVTIDDSSSVSVSKAAPISKTIVSSKPSNTNPTGGGSSTSSDTSTSNNNTSSGSTSIGAIVGGAVGGVAVLALIAFGIWFAVRRNKNKVSSPGAGGPAMHQQPQQPGQPSIAPGGQPAMYNNAAYGPGQPGAMAAGGFGYPPEKGALEQTYEQHQQAPAYPSSPVSAMTEPNRMSMLPPAAPASPAPPLHAGAAAFQHPQHTGSTMTTTAAGAAAPFQHPQHTGASGVSGYGGGAAVNVPSTVHEAGGDAIGAFPGPGGNANHHGLFHEMA